MEKNGKKIIIGRISCNFNKSPAVIRMKNAVSKVRGQITAVIAIGTVSALNLAGIDEEYSKIILVIPLIYSSVDANLFSGLLSWMIICIYYIVLYFGYKYRAGISIDGANIIIDLISFAIIVFLADYLKEKMLIKADTSRSESQINKKLMESRKRYRRLMESIPDAVLIHVDGRIVFANRSFAEMIGADDRKKLYGMNIFDFIISEFNVEVMERIQKGNKKVPLIEEQFKRIDGSIVHVEAAAIYYEYDDVPASLMVVRDITERKQSEELKRNIEENKKLLRQALEYDKLKNEFLANISHELRTPLNVILSALQLLEIYLKDVFKDVENHKINRYTVMMRQNCYRLLRLINNLIDITKIDAGYLKINLQNKNIVSVVEDIVLSVAEYIENKSIYLQFDTDAEEKIMALDPDKIERIILNLLSNAIKFTEPGGSIFVDMKDEGDNMAIYVRDTGTGIEEDKINHIFERFIQANKSLIKNSQGSGIGLSLVKSLVELHSGSIYVKSQYGKGTEFIVKLPVILLDEDKTCKEDEHAQQDRVEKINIEFSDIYS